MSRPTHIGAIHTAFSVQSDFYMAEHTSGLALDMIGARYRVDRGDSREMSAYPDQEYRRQIQKAIIETTKKIWGGA